MAPASRLNFLRALLKASVVRRFLIKKREWQRSHKFKREFKENSALLADGRFHCRWHDRWPCLDDATGTTSFDAHYLYHTAWAARVLEQQRPDKHVDIGSCLRFASLVSAFTSVDFYDYRPAQITLSGLTCNQADILALPFEDASIFSLSCMHVVEHIGLGRYGDPFDPHGDVKAMRELMRVLDPRGSLLFVVPLGGEARIQYNAHRIYTYRQVINFFSKLTLTSFSLITDSGEFINNAREGDSTNQRYGCGCFYFTRPN